MIYYIYQIKSNMGILYLRKQEIDMSEKTQTTIITSILTLLLILGAIYGVYCGYQIYINDHIEENKTIKHDISKVVKVTYTEDKTVIKLKNGDTLIDEPLVNKSFMEPQTAYPNKYMIKNKNGSMDINKNDIITYKTNRVKQDHPLFCNFGNPNYPEDGYVYTIEKVES